MSGVIARDSAGVRIVELVAPPSDTIVPEEPYLTIGRTSRDAASAETFQGITDVQTLSRNRFLVLDNRGVRIAVFGSDGSWQFDIGRLGTGPGQFVAPRSITVHEDTVFVWDGTLQRLMAFTDQGRFVRSVTIPARSGPLQFAAVASGFIEAVGSEHREEQTASAALVRWSENEQTVDTIAGPYPLPGAAWRFTYSISSQTLRQPTPMREGTVSGDRVIVRPIPLTPPIFSPRHVWAAAGDRVVLALPETPVVEVRDAAAGTLRMRLRLRNRPDSVTESDREAYFEAHLRYASELPHDYEVQLRSNVVFATVRPAISAFVLDDRDRIWLADFDPAAGSPNFVSSEWNVFSENGSLLARVRFPEFFQLLRVQNDRSWGRMLKSDRFGRSESVQVYRLDWR